MSRDTRKELQLAIARIKHGRTKVVDQNRRLSILAVAEEAGLSSSTIHNRYPDVAQAIREAASGARPSVQEARPAKVDKLKELRDTLSAREAEIRALALINPRLSMELQAIKQELADTLARVQPQRPRSIKPSTK
ncbi:TetR family transcriptional regulator [Robbsia andropogonis]|uniref:TetR family transcriptional regulator n=1 Tax=Robbsia andropogonis TaxID=28092 RepID=UPI00209F3B5B|nr:TetR family transcriptional regulator [Robbsia andropogonis]MCP1121601.1 TetR family transcriptional regulator [Robbsia andropogonis]MCP1131441.1 TetR family transcriptional regulator [Robbsia andropogonis]